MSEDSCSNPSFVAPKSRSSVFEWLSQREAMMSAFGYWTQLMNTGIWPRERRLSTVTTLLNDRLRVVTADSILDQGRILHDSPRLRSPSRHIAKDCGHRFDGAHVQAEAQRPIAEKIFAAVRAWQLLIFGHARRASPE